MRAICRKMNPKPDEKNEASIFFSSKSMQHIFCFVKCFPLMLPSFSSVCYCNQQAKFPVSIFTRTQTLSISSGRVFFSLFLNLLEFVWFECTPYDFTAAAYFTFFDSFFLVSFFVLVALVLALLDSSPEDFSVFLASLVLSSGWSS